LEWDWTSGPQSFQSIAEVSKVIFAPSSGQHIGDLVVAKLVGQVKGGVKVSTIPASDGPAN